MNFQSVLMIARPGSPVPAFHSGYAERETAQKVMREWANYYRSRQYHIEWRSGLTKVIATKFEPNAAGEMLPFDTVELFIS